MRRPRKAKEPFGWGYPAGAEHDPNAPYNQEDFDYCPMCKDGNLDEDGEFLFEDGPFCSEECKTAYEISQEDFGEELLDDKYIDDQERDWYE